MRRSEGVGEYPATPWRVFLGVKAIAEPREERGSTPLTASHLGLQVVGNFADGLHTFVKLIEQAHNTSLRPQIDILASRPL